MNAEPIAKPCFYQYRPWLRGKELYRSNSPYGVMSCYQQYVPAWAVPLDWVWKKIFWRGTMVSHHEDGSTTIERFKGK